MTIAATIDQSDTTIATADARFDIANVLSTTGKYFVYYSLVFVLAYIGGMKFTAYEAQAISGLVMNSPLLAWTYGFVSQEGLANIIGVVELSIAGLLALRPINPKLSLFGGALAIGLFITTLSFLFSTPGIVEASLGFPAITVMPGQFLLKDVMLLGVAVFIVGDSLKAITDKRTR